MTTFYRNDRFIAILQLNCNLLFVQLKIMPVYNCTHWQNAADNPLFVQI